MGGGGCVNMLKFFFQRTASSAIEEIFSSVPIESGSSAGLG